jgi:hypothetical protein
MLMLEAAQANFVATINQGPDALDPNLFAGPIDRVLLGLKAHANTINHARLVALEDSFPLTRQEMGDAAFNALSREFVETDEAKASDIAAIGQAFAAFLKLRGIDQALVDLAAIEWAWLESYHAAEGEPLSPETIGTIGEAALLKLKVAAHPATRLVALNAPLSPALSDVAPEGQPHAILIVRPEAEVRLVALDAATTALAEKCTSPVTIGNLLTLAAEQLGMTDPSGPVLTLIGAGALVAME